MKGVTITALMTFVIAIPLLWGRRLMLHTEIEKNNKQSNEEDERYTIDELIM